MELPRALAELPVDHERLFGEAAERISRLVGDLCAIAVVSGPGGRIDPVAVSHPDPEVRAIVEEALQVAEFRPEDWPIASEALARGAPLLIADAGAARLHDRVNSWIRPYVERVEVRSLLFLPVRARGRTIGMVALVREGDSAAYTPDDQAIVSAVVDRVALTLDNARLVRTLRRQGELDAALLAVQSDLGEGIAVLDLDSERIVHANDAFGSMLGYRPAELERLPSFHELLDSEAQPPGVGEGSAAVTLEERLSAESPLGRRTLVLRRKDGERVEAEVATKRLEAAGGNRLVALVRDVTERNRNEREALLRAELLDEVDAAVIRTDAHGTVLHWNRGAERLYGRSREDAVGRAARELLLPAPERHGRSDEVRRAIAGRGAFEGEHTVVRPNGTTVPVDVRVATTGDGGLVAVAVDATERRRAQRELEESREKFRAQYKGLPIPTYTWRSAGEDFVLIDYNDAADRFTEGHVAGLLGTRASELYGHDPLIIAELKESLVARGSVSRELDFPMPSIGETKRLAFTYVYVPPNIVMVHAEDVTARRKAEAELRFQAELLDQVGAAVVACDLEGTITHWNRGAEELFGLRAPDAVGRSVVAIVSQLDIEERGTLLEQIRAGQAFEADVRLRRDGRVVPVFMRTAPITDADGERVGHVGISVDVTERQLAERALREAEERYRSLVERLPAITYVRDLGPSGRWRYVSPQVGSMLGYTPEEWEADPELWRRLLHPEDRDRVLAAMARAEAAGEPVAVEYRIAGRDGDVRWLRHEAVVRREAIGGGRTEGLLTDITERKRFESQLQFLADHDALTELYNRRRFVQELAREVRLVDRGHGTACVLMLDIDNFKYINDSLGHQAGDSLIRSVAGVLRRRVRASDTLARLGGDEFAMLLRGTAAHEAQRVAGELLADIRDRWHPVAAEPVRVTASIGIAELEPGASAEGALAAADLGMYEAKHQGRDRYAVFSPELHARAEAGRSLTEQIRTALERDRFVLYAQPVIDLRTGAVAQHELLIRMLGEGDQLIAPGTFLPTAERFDLVQGIDRWVVGQAIAQIAERGRRGDRLRLGVNLSGQSIADPTLTRFLESELERHSVDPDDLVLEVTETSAIANMDQARDFAERVARLGCRLALDDFGSGFGSFYYLKYLPVHYLKIDGDFVRKLPTARIDREVVRAIVKLAGSVGTGTMAEFVGDEQTLDLLREFGVDYAQGYHVGRPRPVAEL